MASARADRPAHGDPSAIPLAIVLVGLGVVALLVTTVADGFLEPDALGQEGDWARAYAVPFLALATTGTALAAIGLLLALRQSSARPAVRGAAMVLAAWIGALGFIHSESASRVHTALGPSSSPLVLYLLFGLALPLLAAAWTLVPPWVAWLVPSGLAGCYLAAYVNEDTLPAEFESQAGLVLFTGCIAVALSCLAVLAGVGIRRSGRPRLDSNQRPAD